MLGTPGVLLTVGSPGLLVPAYMLAGEVPGVDGLAGAVPPATEAIAFGVALAEGGLG